MALDLIPNAMHRLEILLRNRFNLDRVHIGSVHRFTDRLGIIGIVLIALDEWLNKLRGNDVDRVTPPH